MPDFSIVFEWQGTGLRSRDARACWPRDPDDGHPVALERDGGVRGRRLEPAAWLHAPTAHVKEFRMAKSASGKPMSKSETAAFLAEKAGISKKQATAVIQAQADLAYKQAKNTFVIPGI